MTRTPTDEPIVGRCPYCRDTFTDTNPPTADHVFLESRGGHAKIPSCAHCNNQTFGAEIEGRLQRPNTVAGFTRHAAGDPSKRFRATSTQNPQPLEVDLVNRDVRSSKPVEVDWSDPDKVTYTVRGSEDQVRDIVNGIAKKHRLPAERAQEIMADAQPTDLGELAVTLTYDVSLATRSAAKIALGALILARGDAAADSTLAASLRDIAFANVDPALVPAVPATPTLDTVRGFAASAGQPLEKTASAAIFLNSPGHTTVFVQLAGELLPPFGLHVTGTMPNPDLIATAIQDAPHQPRITEIAGALAAAAAALAATDDSPEPDHDWPNKTTNRPETTG